ncbi:class I SAM-dependent methyltransferase [Aeromonas bivalvium]|uniref:class I SAM-dependent methyltransferase n=1 Tax=Aeromonas bivalvium TaxID=440079 RepID=UPI0038D23F97
MPMPDATTVDLHALCTARAPLYRAFLAELPPGAHLLDAGCGEGHDARHFQQEGHVVSAIERDLAAARRASRHGALPVRVGDILTLTTVVPFDGIWACDLLPGGEHEPALLARLGALLKVGGLLYCNLPAPLGLDEDAPPFAAHGLCETRRWLAPLPRLASPALGGESPSPDAPWLHLLLRKTAL